MIELNHLKKTFPSASGDFHALEDVTLTIPDGAIFGVIGPSGAGKSTLVRCINLLERPTSGQVLLDGEDLTRMPKRQLGETRRRIGMIFQSFNLLEQRTVAENVRFPLELSHTPRKVADARVGELLSLVGLSEKASSYPSQLSGGQKQRAAIARSLATAPRYLLCDEATSALDPETTDSVLALLREINRTQHVTVILVTHEMRAVERICTEVAVLDGGRIVEHAPTKALFSHPMSQTARRLLIHERFLSPDPATPFAEPPLPDPLAQTFLKEDA